MKYLENNLHRNLRMTNATLTVIVDAYECSECRCAIRSTGLYKLRLPSINPAAGSAALIRCHHGVLGAELARSGQGCYSCSARDAVHSVTLDEAIEATRLTAAGQVIN